MSKDKELNLPTAIIFDWDDTLVDNWESINSALNMGINYFDTAPWYGLGRSELRIGNILREMNRDKFILSTKVGRILKKTKMN